MALTLRRYYAGSQRIDVLTTRCGRYDGPAQRAEKKKLSSEAQQRLNLTNSWRKLELMLSTNFPTAGSGLVVTLTCDNDHVPERRAQMARWLQVWRRKMNAERKEAGQPALVAFWSIEVLTSSSGRWHAHLVINNTGNDADAIRRSWIYGRMTEFRPLRTDSEKNWETLARYMTKEPRECQEDGCRLGARGWSYTRNAKKPEVETMTVPDDYRLSVPEGCTVLIDERKSTVFGRYHILKYRFDGVRSGHRRRPDRRRGRQRSRLSL